MADENEVVTFANEQEFDRMAKAVRAVERMNQSMTPGQWSSQPLLPTGKISVRVTGARYASDPVGVSGSWKSRIGFYPGTIVYRDPDYTSGDEYEDGEECYVKSYGDEDLETAKIYSGKVEGDRNDIPVVSVDDPIAATSGATSHWLEPVECVVTAAYVPTGVGTWDGVALGTGDRVLVWDVVASFDTHAPVPTNGIYIVNHAGAWTRAPDADTMAKLFGAVVFVKKGGVYGGITADCYYVEGVNIDVDDVGFKAQIFRGLGDGFSIARYSDQFGYYGMSPDPFLRQAYTSLTPAGPVGGGASYLFENLKVPGSIQCGGTVGQTFVGTFTPSYDLAVAGYAWCEGLIVAESDLFNPGYRTQYMRLYYNTIQLAQGTGWASSIAATNVGFGKGIIASVQNGDAFYVGTTDNSACFGINRLSGTYTGDDGTDSVGNTFVGGICTSVGSGGISVDGGTW